MASTVLAAGLLLAAGTLPGAPAVAQDFGDGRADRVNRLLSSDGLTRAEMVSLYESLVQGEFEPPACVAGDTRFDDVPASHPFCAWIEELARRGITGGCTETLYCPGAPVSRAQMAAFILRATADEAFHVVGDPGEPAFGDGGEGDCLWQNPPPSTPLLGAANPVSFFKDSDGIVHLAGLPLAVDGPGGDAACGGTDTSDLVIFELPEGYRPENLEIFVSGNSSIGLNLIVPEGGLTVDGEFIPGGSVLVSTIMGGNATTLDGFTFRAAEVSTTVSSSREPASVSLQALRDLLD